MFGFWLTFADGIAYPLVEPWGPLPKAWAENWIVKRDRCLFGRGAYETGIGGHEISASGNFLS